MSNTTSLKGQRPNLDGTCPNGLYLPCMYNNKLSYICDPFGDRSKTTACSRVDTVAQCPILPGGPPTYCSETVQPPPEQPPPEQPPTEQPPTEQPPPVQPPPEQPPPVQPPPVQPPPEQPPPEQPPPVQPQKPLGMKKVGVSFIAYLLHIFLIIASIIVIICYNRQIPKNKVMLSVNVCTLIVQLASVVILVFM